MRRRSPSEWCRVSVPTASRSWRGDGPADSTRPPAAGLQLAGGAVPEAELVLHDAEPGSDGRVEAARRTSLSDLAEGACGIDDVLLRHPLKFSMLAGTSMLRSSLCGSRRAIRGRCECGGMVGGSDAGIEAARRCRELAPEVEVTVLVADGYPNLSICGLPYWHSREVEQWQDLAHGTVDDLEATGMRLLLEHRVTGLDLRGHTLQFTHRGGAGQLSFDGLVLATGAVPARPPIEGLADLARRTECICCTRCPRHSSWTPASAGPSSVPTRWLWWSAPGTSASEMAEAMTTRGMRVVVLEQLPWVLPRTLDASLARDVEAHLRERGVDVRCGIRVRALGRGADGDMARVRVELEDEALFARPGAGGDRGATGHRAGGDGRTAARRSRRDRGGRADENERRGRVGSGGLAHTHHRLLGEPTYLPLGTTAHKQGRVAGRT